MKCVSSSLHATRSCATRGFSPTHGWENWLTTLMTSRSIPGNWRTLSHELRSKAMMEIWAARGLEGALALLADCDARAGWKLHGVLRSR